MEKITTTKRDMFVAIKALAEGGSLHVADFDENITDEMIAEFCTKEIAALDNKAIKAKERAAAKRAENDELLEVVRSVMSTEEFETIKDIASRIEGEDVTDHKVMNRLSVLVREGLAEKSTITVPATETTKARKLVAYKLIAD